jgi:predicted dehydrogenase
MIIKKKYKITYIKKLEDIKIFKYKIDVAFVFTPSTFHIDQEIWLLNNNINLFVEKPIGISQKNISKLNKSLKNKMQNIWWATS